MKTKLYKFKKAISNKKGDASYVSVVIVMFVILVFFATFLGYWHTNQKIELTEENMQLALDNYLMDHYSNLYEPLANGGKDSKMTEETYKRTFQSIFDKLNVETVAKYMEKNSPYTITNDKDNITAYDTEGDVAFKLNDISLSYKLDSKYANGNGEVNFQPKLIADYKVETVINLALVKPTINYSTESFSSYKLKYVNEYDDNGTKKAESDNNTPDLSNKTAKYTLHYNDNKTANLSDNYKPSEVKNLPIPRRSNYTFAGWYRSTVLSGATYSSTPSTYEGDVDYYAKWVNSYHEISNEVKVTFAYYDIVVPSTIAGSLSSTPSTYSYTYNGLPGSCFDYYGKDNQKINFSKVIKYAAENTRDPDNYAHSYYYWTSQAEAEEGIQTLPDYHSTPTTNSDGEWVYENYSKQIYHPDTYGNPQTSGEKFVTYYDNEGNEIPESDIYEQNANISEIKVWYVNTLKKFKVTAHIVNEDTSEFEENSNGTFVGTKKVIIPNAFHGSSLGYTRDDIALKYGVTNITPPLITQKSFTHNGTTYYFQYWAHDKKGNGITSAYHRYTARITGNETLYAIYDTKELQKVGLSTLNPYVGTYTASNNVTTYRLSGLLAPYNCPDNDTNIKKVGVLFIRANTDVIENSTDEDCQRLRNNIIKGLNERKYAENTSDVLTAKIVPDSEQIFTSTIPGYIYNAKGHLNNKNYSYLTINFTEKTLKNYSMYAIQIMYYDAINPLTGEKYGWILGDNMIKYKFDSNCNYDITSIQH